jgi:UDP-N-acetylmuramate dehydrogenase
MSLRIQQDIPLAPFTTLGFGGPARYFLTCDSADAVVDGLSFARREKVRLFILGGGSNLVVADGGFDGVVLRPAISGIAVEKTGRGILLTVGAGESWDGLVHFAAEHGYAGIECLSGIPGSVGATPIQNVGAYGQDVQETIHSVEAIERESGNRIDIDARDCGFGYRQSRFKGKDAGKYVVTSVRFLLRDDGVPSIRYPELQRAVAERFDPATLRSGAAALEAVRGVVLALRRNKSMVVDPADPHSRSAGSFFVNPVLDPQAFAKLQAAAQDVGAVPPAFPAEGGTKVPAAWLVEHAGFPRGTRRGGVGLSAHHALALVNYGGSARELLALAGEIRDAVFARFAVRLDMEPVILE